MPQAPDRYADLIYRTLELLEDDMSEVTDLAPTWRDADVTQQRELITALTTIREPRPIAPELLNVHNKLLYAERAERSEQLARDLAPVALDPRLILWRGDITALRVDAIVNAANSALLGCFAPFHTCIDNAIHARAGLGLRDECAQIMAVRNRPEPTGTATLTRGYCLPAEYVIHTVGPIVRGEVSNTDDALLASGYRSCLQAAAQAGCTSIAFCSISTGVFGFPADRAASVAVSAVRAALDDVPTISKVIFDVYSASDESRYRELLGPDA